MIELMVACAILAVLLALLVPTFTKVRQQAISSQCMTNLRQVAAAIRSYANDHDNCLVPGDGFSNSDGPDIFGVIRQSTGSWAVILVDGGYLPAPGGTYVGNRQFNYDENLYANYVLRCPSGLDADMADYGFPPSSQATGVGNMFAARESDYSQTVICTWYAFNGSVYTELFRQRPLPFSFVPDGNPNTFQPDYTLRRLTSFQHNSTTLPLFFDGAWMFYYDKYTINARHDNLTRANILFADFHCESQLASDLPNDNWYVQ